MSKPKLFVAVYDLHYPEHHKPTWNAVMNFLGSNKVDGFIFAGDQFNFDCISHHTKNKPLFRLRAGYMKDVEGFDRDILTPLEKVLGSADKRYIIGNHERFEQDLIEEQPELEDLVDHVRLLKLVRRGWTVIPLGHCTKIGKLTVIHGEILSGFGNQTAANTARKAVELYAGNVLAGHIHTLQQFVKVSPVDQKDKWVGTISPAACALNPAYLRNRPASWVNGFTIVELMEGGTFNLYPIVITNGKFCYGGKVYSA